MVMLYEHALAINSAPTRGESSPANLKPENEGSRCDSIVGIESMEVVSERGSHRAFRHPEKPMVVTVPGNANDDLPIGTLKSILRKAEVKEP
jgi:predicted RNA binding protein YcfA (HicA-like mRNA interferase family)